MIYRVIFLVIAGLIGLYVIFRQRKVIPPKKTKHVFGIISDTKRGERVRSKAEKTLADYFFENKIDYIYEKTIVIGKRKLKIKYDFYLPGDDVYVEYWGMENSSHEIKVNYLKRKKEKIKIYNHYHLKLVSIYPKDLSNIDSIFPMKLLTSKKMYSGVKFRIIVWLRSLLFNDYQFYGGSNLSHQNSNTYFCVFCGICLPGSVKKCNRCGSAIPF